MTWLTIASKLIANKVTLILMSGQREQLKREQLEMNHSQYELLLLWVH
jgi:hypothetical protein